MGGIEQTVVRACCGRPCSRFKLRRRRPHGAPDRRRCRPTQVHALLPSEPAFAVVEVPGAEQARCQTAAVQPEATRTVWHETLEVRSVSLAHLASTCCGWALLTAVHALR